MTCWGGGEIEGVGQVIAGVLRSWRGVVASQRRRGLTGRAAGRGWRSCGAIASGFRGRVEQEGAGGWQGEVLPGAQVIASCERGSAGAAAEGDEYTAAARGGSDVEPKR